MTLHRAEIALEATLLTIEHDTSRDPENVTYVLSSAQIAHINSILSFTGIRLRIAQLYVIKNLVSRLHYSTAINKVDPVTMQFNQIILTKL